MSEHHYALKMRQSMASFERAFHHETAAAERQRAHMQRAVAARSRARFHRQVEKRRSIRFYLLTLSLVATAVFVTVAMLALLYLLLT